MQITKMKCEELTLHPLANTTPCMSSEQFEALKADMEMNGQLEPITLYRNRIIDGRHRWRALRELREDFIKTMSLPNNTKIQELEAYVNSKEIRRHESPAQLAIRAYKLKTMPDSQYSSFAKAAAAVGANVKRVSEAKQIVEVYKRPDILEWLYEGNKFDVGVGNTPFYTDSLGTILNWLKEYGTINSNGDSPVQPREELTGEEEILCTQYLNVISKESELVIKTIASRLYSQITKEE